MTAATPPPTTDSEDPRPLLTMHATVVLLTAAFIGMIVGVLSMYSTDNIAAALLAGLTSVGTSIPVLHKLIGR